MKRRIFALAMALMLVFSVVGVCAATANHSPNEDNTTYTVTYSGLKPGAMYGMLVLAGTGDFAVSEENILYIDQATADADGKVVFPNFAPKGVSPADESFVESTVYLGGGDWDSAQAVGVLKKVGGNVMLGDVYEDEKVNTKDSIKLSQYLAHWEITLTPAEELAADVYKDDKINTKDSIKLSQFLAGWFESLE